MLRKIAFMLLAALVMLATCLVIQWTKPTETQRIDTIARQTWNGYRRTLEENDFHGVVLDAEGMTGTGIYAHSLFQIAPGRSVAELAEKLENQRNAVPEFGRLLDRKLVERLVELQDSPLALWSISEALGAIHRSEEGRGYAYLTSVKPLLDAALRGEGRPVWANERVWLYLRAKMQCDLWVISTYAQHWVQADAPEWRDLVERLRLDVATLDVEAFSGGTDMDRRNYGGLIALARNFNSRKR